MKTQRSRGHINLLPVSSRHRRRSRWWVGVLIGIGSVVLLLGLIVLYYVPKAQQAIAAGKNMSHAAKKLQDDLGQQKFTEKMLVM